MATSTNIVEEDGFDDLIFTVYDTISSTIEHTKKVIQSSSAFSAVSKATTQSKEETAPIVNKFSARPDVVRQYVQRMLDNEDLNIAWIPDVVETKIYSMVVELAINCCYSLIRPLEGLAIGNHHIEMELIKGTGIPVLPKDSIDKRNLNIIVDKMVGNPNIDAVWLPASVKRELFFKILYIFLNILQVFVGSTECDIIGQTLAAQISKQPMKPKTKTPFQRFLSNINNMELEKYLDKYAAPPQQQSGPTKGFIDKEYLTTPDVTRSLYKIVYVMVLVIIEEIFDDFRLNLVGDAVRFTLRPGKQTLALSLAQEVAMVAQNQADELKHLSAGLTTKESTSNPTSSNSKMVVDTDTAKQKNKANSDKRLHTLLTERETLSARLHCVQRQISTCEEEITNRRNGMPAKQSKNTPIKTDRAQSNNPYGTPNKEHQHHQPYERRLLSPLQSYTDDDRYSNKRQGGRTKVHSMIRSPTSH